MMFTTLPHTGETVEKDEPYPARDPRYHICPYCHVRQMKDIRQTHCHFCDGDWLTE